MTTHQPPTGPPHGTVTDPAGSYRTPPPSGTHAKVGLQRDQAVRADAAGIAATLLGDCSGTPAGVAARLVELATPIAGWIRDGTPPEGDGECTCGQAAPPVLELDPACPEHGSQP